MPLIRTWLNEGNDRSALPDLDVRRLWSILSGETTYISVRVALMRLDAADGQGGGRAGRLTQGSAFTTS